MFPISALARKNLEPMIHTIYEHVAAQQRPEPVPDQRFDVPAPRHLRFAPDAGGSPGEKA